MYTILMNSDKSLITSVRTTLYQRENLVDKIQFLLPEYYEDIDLTDCIAVLKYVDQGNVRRSEILSKDPELYKGKVRFILPVDTKLNYFAGNIVIRLSLIKTDDNGKINELLKTGETTLSILPDDTFEYSADIVEQMNALQVKVNENKTLIDDLQQNKADDISYEDNTIQLLSNQTKIGTAHILDQQNEFDLVEFGNSENSDESNLDEDTFIEF